MASTNPQVVERERLDFESYVGEFSEFKALDSIGRYRKTYRDVMSDGLSVLEGQNVHAIEETEALFKEVFNG